MGIDQGQITSIAGIKDRKKSTIVLENPDLLTAIWGGTNSKIPFFDKYPHFGVLILLKLPPNNTEDISIYHDHELLSDETFASSPEKHSP